MIAHLLPEATYHRSFLSSHSEKVQYSDHGRKAVNLCYCDETGMGDEPIAVMVGIVVDSQRMHITKDDWGELLEVLSTIAGRQISELHTSNFYAGTGIWKGMDGPLRAKFISALFDWLAERRHHVVYTSVNKESYHNNFAKQYISQMS